MIPQTKTQFNGRLGIEVVGKMKGCCVESVLDWKPQMLGMKLACRYCNNVMKTIRAGEVISHAFNGGFGRDKSEITEPELCIGGLYFSTKKFAGEEAVKSWMQKRECGEPEEIHDIDGRAFYVPVERILPQSLRLIWAGAGVLAELGVSEKQVVTGGGQASMQSPGITTTSLATGGMNDPSQGPAAVNQVTSPTVLHGMTEMNDGHQHEYHLVPFPEMGGGVRVKGYTSFNNGHTHMIEAALGSDGSLDSRTAPDQTPVGGHAHAHRVIGTSGAAPAVMRSDETAQGPLSKEAMNIFRGQLDAAAKKAKGKFAPVSA